MINKKYVGFLTYKYRRFHVWFNKKIGKYFPYNTITDMTPYDHKKVHKLHKEIDDHWTNLIHFMFFVFIMALYFIIVYNLIN